MKPAVAAAASTETPKDPSDTFVNIHLHSREYYENNPPPNEIKNVHHQQNVENDEENAENLNKVSYTITDQT